MADVLLARTDGIEGFERHVVLKRIRSEHARDPHFIKMFLDEARVAANLHHQHIVQVNDIGEAAGQYFFAMEYIHGEDVRAMLAAASKARMHVPLGVVVAIGSAAAAGLHYAHERRAPDKRPLNIVHCDVSPSNILVGYDGAIKVVDFGIAKAALRSEETRSGYLKGKTSYMSPEQCTGAPIDRRSDVFSLGIVLYELATTSRLFKGANDGLIMDAIVKGRAPLPRVRRPDLPNELAMIIMRALDTEPDRRFQTAEELRLALDRFAASSGLQTSDASVAAALKKMFGERPEPWLDLPETPEPRPTWTDMPSSDAGTGGTGTGPAYRTSEVAMSTDRYGAVHARSDTAPSMGALLALAPAPQPPPPLAHPPAPGGGSTTGRKIGIAALSIAALGAVAVAVFVGRGGGGNAPAQAPAIASTAAAAAPAPAPAPAPRPQVTPIEAPTAREMTVAPAEPVATKDPAPATTTTTTTTAARRTTPTAVKTVAAATTTTTTTAANTTAAPSPATPTPVLGPQPAPPEPVPAIASAQIAPAVPEPPKPAAPAPAPAAAPEPAKVAAAVPKAAPAEPAIPVLPAGVINRVAWEHSRDLQKCEGKETLKGEVTVKFHVTPDGRVTQPQIATQMGKPKLASCILRSLARWKFAKQPPTGAQGSYTIVFQ